MVVWSIQHIVTGCLLFLLLFFLVLHNDDEHEACVIQLCQ